MIEKIINKMIEKGISNKQLSEMTGITESTISNILNRKRKPNHRTMFKISKALNMEEE